MDSNGNLTTQGNVGVGTSSTGGGNLIVNGGGNVGINTAWPGQKLDIQGTVRATGLAMSGQTPVSGYVLTATDSGGDTTWSTAGSVAAASGWTQSGTNVYTAGSNNVGIGTSDTSNGKLVVTGGNVGIGTTTPQGGFVVTNGNVGIGTWAPSTFLQVIGSGDPAISLLSGSATAITSYNIGRTSTDGKFAVAGSAGSYSNIAVQGDVVLLSRNANNLILSAANNSGAIEFSTGTTDTLKAIITQAGNVGIGSTVPGQVLDVSGNIRTRGTNELYFGDDNKAGILASAATTPDMKFLTNSAEIMRITNGGNVGIGSITPGQKLDVQGTVRATGLAMSGQTPVSGYVLTATDSGGDTTWSTAGSVAAASGWTQSGTNVYTAGSNNVGIGTSDTSNGKLVVTGGNVGIGTTVPVSGLDVKPATNVAQLTLEQNNTTDGWQLFAESALGDLTFSRKQAGTVTERVRFANGGNVGIGTVNPGQGLDVVGGVRLKDSAATGRAALTLGDNTYNNAAGYIYYHGCPIIS